MNELPKDIENIVPNVRFGTTFLDILHRDRAVNGEVLMDKAAGDLIYKRKEDGRMFWYSQEKILPFEFLGQIRARMKTNDNFIIPKSTSSVYDDTYFVSSLLDAKTWTFEEREDGLTPSLLLGDKLPNTYPDLFSISYESNGFFIQLNVAPKDLGFIQLLNGKYNATYENYNEVDIEGLEKKALYEKYNYKEGQITVNYTVDWYDTSDELVHTETTDAYVCVNEVTFVPFATQTIFSRDVVAYAKMKINYIEAPKLKAGLDLFTSESELALVRSVKDNFEISFMTMNVSYFLTLKDKNLYLANWINHTEMILAMGIPEFLNMIDRTPLSGKEYGVRISIQEPDKDIWKTTSIWVELMRKIHPHGGDSIHGDDVEYTGSPTSISEIEDGINGIIYSNVDLSLNREDKAFYVENTGQIIINVDDDGGD